MNSSPLLPLLLLLTLASQTFASGPTVPVAHPDRYRLPSTAIDTIELPSMVLTADDPANEPLPYYRIADNTYMLFSNIAQLDDENRGWNGNAGFVVTEEGVFVIDALGTPKLGQRLIATIRTVTDKPIRYLALTHNHPDHGYGASAFHSDDAVQIIGHQGMLDYLDSDRMARSVAYRREILPLDMQGFEAVRPDLLIDVARFSNKRIELGNHRFDIYNAGMHHSHGDLVVHQLPENILWISDLAFNQRTTYMGEGHSEQAIDGLDWLRERFPDASLMVPGHGSAQTSPFPMISQTRAYIQRLRDEMGRAVEEGVGLLEATQGSDFPDWRNTRLYEENHPANASMVYREMEQELF